jgi:excisionase family DNA binding protein
MSAIKDGYVTSHEAAQRLGKGINLIAKLCQSGRLPGSEKIGNTWLIPRASVESYTPGKRGPRTKKEKLSAELEGIRAELAKGE